MNFSYLLSVLDLYLMKEKDANLVVEVDNIENLVKVEFCYFQDTVNRTFVKLPKDIFFDNLSYFIKKIQGNYIILNEKLTGSSGNYKYTVSFGESRVLLFKDFTMDEFKIIRNNFNNLTSDFNFNIKDENSYDVKYNDLKNTKLSLSMGFTTYITLFITSVWFLNILMIALFVFKAFIK